jgi:hypothetical protein
VRRDRGRALAFAVSDTVGLCTYLKTDCGQER